MTKKKKIWLTPAAVLAALLVLIGALAGCGSETPPSSDFPLSSDFPPSVSADVSEAPETPSAPTGETPDGETAAGALPGQTEPSAVLPTAAPDASVTGTLEVHFIDVGQADAALLLCEGAAMLIDGGNVADSSLIYAYLKQHDVSHLDYIVATHAHEDHVGGLAGALNYAEADKALCPVSTYDSAAFSNFVKYLDRQGVGITIPTAGDSFSLGGTRVDVLGPVRDYTDTNNTSIVLRVVYGQTSFLFTGDAEREAEQDILAAGYTLDSTVLKVGHHGSDTSTTYPFLREIMPDYAVISVGSGNSYGHPTEATLSRLRDAGAQVFRTDEQGTVICVSDGKTVSFTTEKNGTAAQPGAVSTPTPTPTPASTAVTQEYVLNTNTHKFHYPTCPSVKQMAEKNKMYFTGTRDEVLAKGYDPCKNCNP